MALFANTLTPTPFGIFDEEVQFQNEKIAERLQSVKSVYNKNSLAEEWMKTEDYFRRAYE